MYYTDMTNPVHVMFLLKNIALGGGYLYIGLYGAGRFSVDGAGRAARAGLRLCNRAATR